MKTVIAVMFALLTLTGFGCSTSPTATTLTPQQTVFEAKASYELALTAAVAYKNLPSCEKSQPPCSTPAVVAQLQKAQPVVRQALDAAESAVRTPGFGTDVVNTSIIAATSALRAFTAITASLPAK